jgi:hypothetical protein
VLLSTAANRSTTSGVAAYLQKKSELNYSCFGIPALPATANHTLLAFSIKVSLITSRSTMYVLSSTTCQT